MRPVIAFLSKRKAISYLMVSFIDEANREKKIDSNSKNSEIALTDRLKDKEIDSVRKIIWKDY